ncbi:MAG: Alpha-1,3-mannosyltransferase-like protein, partial [Candelina submexicana]
MSRKKRVVFIHPDLGIGGAERLVVDAAVGLQDLGHSVTIFTSHRDPEHCFDEARDGTLDVRVRGNSIFPPNILTRFSILCAILRQLHLVLQIYFSGELTALDPDAFFIDQLSACTPLLRFFQPNTRIIFYCHFPDKLLAQRKNWVKRLYRVSFDAWESWTTGLSDSIVVNSNFTKAVFGNAFPTLRSRIPEVIYPCVETRQAENKAQYGKREETKPLWPAKKVLLSINRFERKKDIGLALRAFAALRDTEREGVRLVIAGGYDNRVLENVSYHAELVVLADSLKLKPATCKNLVTALSIPDDIDVLFLHSVPASLKATLLANAKILIYTPSNEHFGIVPLEAMLAGVPVLAANSGGPLETVTEGHSGWLRPADFVVLWTDVLRNVLCGMSEMELRAMGDAGRERVMSEFSERRMAETLDSQIEQMIKAPRQPLLTLQSSLFSMGFLSLSTSLLA